MKQHRFGRLAAGVVLLGSVWVASAASFALPASAYGPHPQCTIRLNHSTLPVHSVVTVTVTCTGNDTFDIVIHSPSATLGTITTNASGTGSATFTIPASLAAGSYVITATDPSGLTLSTGLTLTATAPSTTTAGPLPFTGADVATTAGIGAIAIGGGGLIVLGARRRRRSHQPVPNA
jgi:hypothetical protein